MATELSAFEAEVLANYHRRQGNQERAKQLLEQNSVELTSEEQSILEQHLADLAVLHQAVLKDGL